MKTNDDLFQHIPNELKNVVISLEHLHLSEIAWSKENVIQIIECLQKAEIGILGGDVLSIQQGEYRHNYDNWYSAKAECESKSEFAERSYKEANKYINSYPDPKDGSIAYVLVIEKDC